MSFIILMRHAEKDGNGNLTKKGIINSINMGKDIIKKYGCINNIKSSPLKRCIDTSKFIASELRNNGCTVEIMKSRLLGNPGPFVIDEKQGQKVFDKYGVKKVIELQISGVHLPGFINAKKGSLILLNNILIELEAKKNSLFVSHDVIISVFLSITFGVETTNINYLDSAIIFNNRNYISCLWHNKLYKLK